MRVSKEYLILLGTIIVFFASKWVLDGAWFLGDMITFTGPVENIFRVAQLQGQIPLWDSNIASGYPIIANGQVSFWYLPHILLRFIFPGPYLLNASLLLHSLLGASGMYWWLRRNKFEPAVATMGGGLYVFGGALAARFGLTNFIPPFAWLPWILGLLQAQQLRWWAAASALHVLSGHPQAVILGLIIEFIWLVILRAFVGRLFLAGLLVAGLTAIQIIPTMTLLKYTDRADGLTTDELLDFSIPPKAWWGVIVPHPFGHAANYTGPKGEAELALYIGPLAAGLAGIGLFAGQRRWPEGWWLAVILVGLGILLALGKYSPVYQWLVFNTPQKYFAIPARYGLVIHVGLVLLTALGTGWLWQHIKRWPVVTGLLVVATLVPAAAVAWTWEDGQAWAALRPSPAVARLAGRPDVRLYSKVHLTDMAPGGNFGITLGQPVAAGKNIRQTFHWPYEEVSGLKLRLSVSSEPGNLTAKVFSADKVLLREVVIPTEAIIDGEWTVFAFDTLPNIKDKAGYWELSSDLLAAKAPRLYIHTNPDSLDYDPTGNLGNNTDASFAWAAPASHLIPSQVLLGANVAAGYGIGSTQWTGAFGLSEAKTLATIASATHVIGLFPPHRSMPAQSGFVEEGSWQVGEDWLRVYRNQSVNPLLPASNLKVKAEIEQSFARAWPITLISLLVVLLTSWYPRVGGGWLL